MNEIRDLIIGLDFGERITQLAFYDRKALEARSVSEKTGTREYEIPTALCLRTDHEGFAAGSEALYFADEKDGILLDNLYEISGSPDPVQSGNKTLQPSRLMAEYFLCLLRLLGVADVVRNIRCLVITVRELTPERVRILSGACQEMGLLPEEYLLMDYDQSFYYYAMTSRRENWNRSIGWYDFLDDTVHFSRLRVAGTGSPVLIRLEKPDRTELPSDEKERDAAFTSFVENTLKDELYSTILLTGSGFSQDWAKDSTAFLCRQRRKVYYGNNLFVRGACQGGKEVRENRALKGYRFLCDSMVQGSIGMELRVMGSPAYYPMIEAGKNWYEYHPSCDILLDGESALVFLVTRSVKEERSQAVMKLPGLPDRPPRTTRLHIEMAFTSPSECVIRVADMGFGEMFPSGGLTWEETVSLKEPAPEAETPSAPPAAADNP